MSQRTSFPRNLVTYAYGTVRVHSLEYRLSAAITTTSQETKVLLVPSSSME